jgi:hypothetical protein
MASRTPSNGLEMANQKEMSQSAVRFIFMLLSQASEDRNFREREICFRTLNESEENLDRRVQTRGFYSSMDWLLLVRGRSFQRVGVLAIEHEFTSLVMHRRPRGYDARVSLRCQLSDFELGIKRVPRMHFFQEPARGARKTKKHVADVLRKESCTRSSECENLQSMHQRSSMPVSSRVLDIVVDRVIVSRDRLESGGMRIRQCATRGAEYVADA